MTVQVLEGNCRDVLAGLPDEIADCCVTSPPYFQLRSYGNLSGEIGQEARLDDYVPALVSVFAEVRRVLKNEGTLWLNLGDTRSSDKQILGVPWRVAFALQADGWTFRQDVIWSKPNAMPEPVRDRCTTAHEYLFLFSKGRRYHFDTAAIAEKATQPPGVPKAVAQHKQAALGRVGGSLGANQGAKTRNRRSVWEISTQPFADAHFATYPPALVEPCILAGCPKGGTVLDPFFGAGTTGLVADRLQRNCIGIELNPEYAEIARERIAESRGGGLLDVMEGAA